MHATRSLIAARACFLWASLHIVRLRSETCSSPEQGKRTSENFAPGEQQRLSRGHSLLQTASVRFRRGDPESVAAQGETGPASEVLYSMEVAVSSTTGNMFGCKTPVNASQMSPDQYCPPACPFWAEDAPGSPACRFQCLPAADCGSLVADASIADRNGMLCRTCAVPNCRKCVHRKLEASEEGGSNAITSISDLAQQIEVLWGGAAVVLPEEQCVKCSSHYRLVDGRCHRNHSFLWNMSFVFTVVVMLFFAAWYVHLVCRPITNDEGLEFGLRCRSRTRLHMGADHFQRREYSQQLWPLTTDLRRMEVAGPGLMLFFNFHSFVAGWALLVAAGWVLTGILVSKDLLVLGTLPASTPQQMCSVTSWGHHVQESTMWAKVVFTFVVYVSTFLASVIHAVFQLRRFQAMDDETTMEDFAAVCKGVSDIANSDSAEEELTKALKLGTGEHVVGTSICWDFADVADHVKTIAERDMARRHSELATISGKHFLSKRTVVPIHREWAKLNWISKLFRVVDSALGFVDVEATSSVSSSESAPSSSSARPSPRSRSPPRSSSSTFKTEERAKNDERVMLRSLKSSDYAFVVFETEASRDAAVTKTRESGGILYEGGKRLSLSKMTCEPDTVIWTNFVHGSDWQARLVRLALGVLLIIAALLVWALCIYLPYAYYVCSFSYARGESPGLFASSFFMVLVVTGNQIMYFLCSHVAYKVRFWFSDSVEVTYLVLYTFACIVNVCLDLVITFRTTYSAMEGIQARTYNGQPLTELSTVELFMSYPMQKALGHQLFWYAFPCCFLIPFVLEPIFTIYLPRHISELIVRSNSTLRGTAAEEALKYWVPMDLSRYADILLNMSIAVMVLFFPGGYTWKMFGIMWISHVYIYGLDHYRVLRAVPGFHISGTVVDQCANALMVIPCSIILACLIFKIHCLQGFQGVKYQFVWQSVMASFLHIIVHWLVLAFLVPYFGRPHRRSNLSYQEAASRIPCSWFNANFVHCLRSKYIHRHHPCMVPYVRGKEHLLLAHAAIGAHFHGTAVLAHDISQ
mmetsp:Transcript_145866/g.254470  ORF Transcript_145866/g.254470 Transcript_145866/m.254470 type:complete len:1035 (-) Transcript_145866:122-3226(-)